MISNNLELQRGRYGWRCHVPGVRRYRRWHLHKLRTPAQRMRRKAGRQVEIYVISQAVEDRMHTPRLLKAAGIKFTLVLDNIEQAHAAHRMGYKHYFSTDGAKGIVAKRNAITARAHGWYIGMDDNIQEFQTVAKEFISKERLETAAPLGRANWRGVFNKTASPKDYIDYLHVLTAVCRLRGTVYGGVATMENPFFRGGKRYAFRRFVKSKVFVMDAKPQLQFKHALCHDSYMTAQVIAKYGSVVVDQRLFYKAKWYERGGLGSRQAREQAGLLGQLDECVAEFPGLVGLGKGKNTALRVLRFTDASVDAWRQEHGYL